MTGTALSIPDLPAFRRDLRQLENPRRWAAELAAANREIAKKAAEWSRQQASSVGRQQAHFAQAITGAGSVTGARVRINRAGPGQTFAGAQGAFWGSKQYAQFPDWVGNSWATAVRGQGPLAINEALADHADDIGKAYLEAVATISEHASNYWTATF